MSMGTQRHSWLAWSPGAMKMFFSSLPKYSMRHVKFRPPTFSAVICNWASKVCSAKKRSRPANYYSRLQKCLYSNLREKCQGKWFSGVVPLPRRPQWWWGGSEQKRQWWGRQQWWNTSWRSKGNMKLWALSAKLLSLCDTGIIRIISTADN